MDIKKGSAESALHSLFLASHNRAGTLSLRMLQYLVENVLKMKRRISFMKLGIEGDSPDSISQYCLINTDNS